MVFRRQLEEKRREKITPGQGETGKARHRQRGKGKIKGTSIKPSNTAGGAGLRKSRRKKGRCQAAGKERGIRTAARQL